MSDVVSQMLAAAGEIYDREVSELMASAHRSALRGIAGSEILAAFKTHVADPKAGAFLPKPADILRHVQAARIADTEDDFARMMDAACFGGQSGVQGAALTLFARATDNASTFDMRQWTYVEWDHARDRCLKLAASTAREQPISVPALNGAHPQGRLS